MPRVSAKTSENTERAFVAESRPGPESTARSDASAARETTTNSTLARLDFIVGMVTPR